MMMEDIKGRADQIDLQLNKSLTIWEKAKIFGKSVFTPQQIQDQKREELLKELSGELKETLGGLEELHSFLDAVEKLAVTSLFVFEEENPFSCLPEGVSPLGVQAVINAARLASPLLLTLKRKAEAFFLPSFHNVEALAFQLNKYIYSTKTICEMMEKSLFLEQKKNNLTVCLSEDLSEESAQNLLCHMKCLIGIRMDKTFRLAFMFQEDGKHFISLFSQRQPRMLQFLAELEERAVQLDRMNTGARISSVAGSSVGVVSGVLSIVGLALIPVTLGASLALTMTGVGLGITSGVNSAVTAITEMAVNKSQQGKANDIFKDFIEDVQTLQECLAQVANGTLDTQSDKINIAVGAGRVAANVCTLGKGIDTMVDLTSTVKLLQTENVVAGVSKVALQEGKAVRNLPRLAADVPDLGQAALRGPLALSQSARAGFIALNALFIGMDVFFICKDSVSLAKGRKSEISQLIRARAALWQSEIEAWQEMRDNLCKAMLTSGKNHSLLEMPLYIEDTGKRKEM